MIVCGLITTFMGVLSVLTDLDRVVQPAGAAREQELDAGTLDCVFHELGELRESFGSELCDQIILRPPFLLVMETGPAAEPSVERAVHTARLCAGRDHQSLHRSADDLRLPGRHGPIRGHSNRHRGTSRSASCKPGSAPTTHALRGDPRLTTPERSRLCSFSRPSAKVRRCPARDLQCVICARLDRRDGGREFEPGTPRARRRLRDFGAGAEARTSEPYRSLRMSSREPWGTRDTRVALFSGQTSSCRARTTDCVCTCADVIRPPSCGASRGCTPISPRAARPIVLVRSLLIG